MPDPAYPGQSENDVQRALDGPSGTEQLRAVLDVLAGYASTPDECYFCLWEGHDFTGRDGGLSTDPVTGIVRQRLQIAPAFPRSVLDGPKVVIPNRSYYLFHGALSDFGDWGAAEMLPGRLWDIPASEFVWPADHAWCVANDVDPHWAGIGADTEAIDQLLADPGLNIVQADPDQDQPQYR